MIKIFDTEWLYLNYFLLTVNNFICPKLKNFLCSPQNYFMVTLRQINILRFGSNIFYM